MLIKNDQIVAVVPEFVDDAVEMDVDEQVDNSEHLQMHLHHRLANESCEEERGERNLVHSADDARQVEKRIRNLKSKQNAHAHMRKREVVATRGRFRKPS